MTRNIHRGAALLAAAFLTIGLGACGGDGGSGSGHAAIASVQASAGDAQNGTVGAALATTLAATVLDSSGHPIVGQVVNFVVTAGGGKVFGGAETTDSGGVAHEQWTLGTTAGAQAVEVRAVGSDGQPKVFATFHATAVAGPAASVAVVSGDAQTATQTQVLPAPIVAVAKDQYGNPVSGATIAFATGSGGALTPPSATTDATGQASATWTLGVAIGSQTATATVASLPAATFSATATQAAPGAPTAIAVTSGDGQTVVQHLQVAHAVVVKVTDALGNAVPGISVTFSAPATTGAVVPSTVITNAQGTASWQGWVHVSGTQSLVASANALTASATVTVTASSFQYDGAYACNITSPASETWRTFGIDASAPADFDVPGFHGIAYLDHANIAPDGSFVANDVEDTVHTLTATGTFVIGADQLATASGTYQDWTNGFPEGIGNFTCHRL